MVILSHLLQERQFFQDGMECVDPEHVVYVR